MKNRLTSLKRISNYTTCMNGLCSNYPIKNTNEFYANDKTLTSYDNFISIHDSSYTNATTFKTAMKGVKLVYELATPVVTDCSDILHPIRCETGGTITFNNEHNLDMPNSIMYKKEVSLS